MEVGVDKTNGLKAEVPSFTELGGPRFRSRGDRGEDMSGNRWRDFKYKIDEEYFRFFT